MAGEKAEEEGGREKRKRTIVQTSHTETSGNVIRSFLVHIGKF